MYPPPAVVVAVFELEKAVKKRQKGTELHDGLWT